MSATLLALSNILQNEQDESVLNSETHCGNTVNYKQY